MSNNMIPYQEVEKMAVAVAKSGLFGAKTPEQAMALMLIAQAEGMHPAKACQDYDIIQGRPALKSAAMLGRYQTAGGIVNWLKHEDTIVSAEFSHPQSPNPLIITWDMARAQKAGLTGKDNWTKYPRQMLRARVISEGVRATFPASCSGLYTPEEVMDMDTPKQTPVVIKNTVEGVKEALKAVDAQIVEQKAVEKPVKAAEKPVVAPIAPEPAKTTSLEIIGVLTGTQPFTRTRKLDGKTFSGNDFIVVTEGLGEIPVSMFGSIDDGIQSGMTLKFTEITTKEFRGQIQYSAKRVEIVSKDGEAGTPDEIKWEE